MAKGEGIAKDSPLLITGAAGFVGRNLVANLRAQGYGNLLLYDMETPEETLAAYARQAAFVFHLAGVNRPKDTAEFYSGNADLTARLLALLREGANKAPVLLTSSAQAGNGSDYAKSKETAEAAMFAHGRENESAVFVYRLPGLFGKWSRPNYNSVVATFCHNIAHGLPIEVRDAAYELPLCYIDDVVAAFMQVMTGRVPPPAAQEFVQVKPVYRASLGWLAQTIQSFVQNRGTLEVPNTADALTAKLYATYLSYLAPNGFAYPLNTHADARGSFTEFLRTADRGQVSVNVARPGIVKGNHWHNTKNEKFLVVRGRAIIRFRALYGREVTEYAVSGEKLEVVEIPPGYTHSIENVGSEDLITVMWASETFDPENTDTWYEEV